MYKKKYSLQILVKIFLKLDSYAKRNTPNKVMETPSVVGVRGASLKNGRNES